MPPRSCCPHHVAPQPRFLWAPRAHMTSAAAACSGGRLIVVLDMDECLIHSTNFSDETAATDSRQAELRPEPVDRLSTEEVQTFLLNMGDGVTCTVHKRPGLDDFLRACADEFDTYVMTAGTQGYAEPLLDVLDPRGDLLLGRFYRHDCKKVTGSWGTQFLKDLAAVVPPETEPSRMVLVDNNPISFVSQPDNGIQVHSLSSRGFLVKLTYPSPQQQQQQQQQEF